MSAWSADWFSLMKTAQVVCSDAQADEALARRRDVWTTPDDPLGQVHELDALGGLQVDVLRVDDEAPGGDADIPGRRLTFADGRALTR